MPIEHYKNLCLENIVEEIDGIVYTEEWRPIAGYEGLYEVSSFGRIKSLSISKGIRIVKSFSSYRYRRVGLFKELSQIKYQVHRLVAIAFIENMDNLPEVNHKKGIRWDNRSLELEWSTSSQNKIHSFEVLGRKANKPWLGKFGKNHIQSHPIVAVCDSGDKKYFESKREVAAFLRVSEWVVANRIKRGIAINGIKLILSK